MRIKVLIADDHQIMRDGLKRLLHPYDWIEIVAEASDGREALSMVKKTKPDIVIMDVSMPELNGIEATAQISSILPDVKILALSMHSNTQFVMNMFNAGASGYILKDCALNDLIDAIQTVLKGEKYISKQLELFFKEHQKEFGQVHALYSDGLSTREREVLQLIAEGVHTKAIAEKLHVSPKTIETHRKNLMEKLKLFTISDLTRYAIKTGLTNMD